jgi:AAA15 family ATPase/GTPase
MENTGVKHLTYFKVENFKRLDSFEMENIGQFNLIVGDNNVGKTTVLESLLVDEDVNFHLICLLAALNARKIVINNSDISFLKIYKNYNSNSHIKYDFILNNISTKLEIDIVSKTSIPTNHIDKLKNLIALNPKEENFIFHSINNEISYAALQLINYSYYPFIPVNLGYDSSFAEFYSKFVMTSNKEKERFIDSLKVFINDISDVEVVSLKDFNSNHLIIRSNSNDKPLLLPLFGEGLIKLFRILLELSMCKNTRLMIDEIDTGIHHSRFKKFLRTILLAAKRNNVQLFATTHSKECLQYFKEVLEEEEMKDLQKDTRCIRLVESENNAVKSFTYDFERFQFAVEQENELR